jgi:RNA polymerase subunit RPABC4/transcription elongation factor Spt4
MPPVLNSIIEFISSPSFGTLQIVVIAYFGLLWLAIIIWVTKDAINRSNSVLFQTFSILISIAVPILGVLLYLIIRPSRTALEKYYEELEKNLVNESPTENSNACSKCLTLVESDYRYCPNCGESVKKSCRHCKAGFPKVWSICPYCGKEEKMSEPELISQEEEEDIKNHEDENELEKGKAKRKVKKHHTKN